MCLRGRVVGLWLGLLASLSLVGCSSESSPPVADDAAVEVVDSGTNKDAGLGRRPRPDQGTQGDPLPACERFSPTACAAGQKCQVVIRRAPEEEQFSIYPGCVDRGKERGLGAPCVAWDVTFEAPGLEDEIYVDPCAEGLICTNDPDVRNHMSCQPACETGMAGQPYGCSSARAFCSSSAGPLREVCVETEGCDPRDPNACGQGRACYVIPDDTITGVLGLCTPVISEPVPAGEPCSSFTAECEPGTICWGPTRVPPMRWVDEDLICRRACSADADPSDFDAGDEQDGGAARGIRAPECRRSEACVPFTESGLDNSTIDAPFGLCES